ncbi:alpha/beta hydrolases superfamily protein, partial [Tanacetum coccineum]
VKEKQNSSSHDPVTVTGGVKKGTGTSANSDVNVDQNALNSGMNTLGKTFGNSNAERANTVGKESESLNSSPTGIASSHIVSFATLVKDGMDSMLENGLWLIRNVQLILKKWTPGANIINEDVCNIPVWVKFHDIPKTIFTDDGLSALATKFGNPLMLDSYTTAMCTDSWGRANECIKKIESDVLHNLKKPTQAIRGIQVTKATNATTSILNSFDALNTLVDEDNCGGMNYASTQEPKQVEGNEKKDINTSVPSSSCYKTPISVVSSVHGSLPVESNSHNSTPPAEKISKLEKQMVDGKPLNKVDSDSESEVEVVYDETTQFMASGGANDAS